MCMITTQREMERSRGVTNLFILNVGGLVWVVVVLVKAGVREQ